MLNLQTHAAIARITTTEQQWKEAQVAEDFGTSKPLDKQLEAIAWALFLIMSGGIILVPDRLVPEGTWLIGVGLIMLGLNLARYVNHIKTSGFTTILGLVALLAGIGDMLGGDLPVLAILLILVGIYLIFRNVIQRDRP